MPDLFPLGMIRPGDVIEINGTHFELPDPLSIKGMKRGQVNVFVDTGKNGTGPRGFFRAQGAGAPTLLARPLNDSGQQIQPEYDHNGYELDDPSRSTRPSPYWSSPAPYRILRQPTPTSDEPYQLPEGTAIDLRASGVGSDNYFYVPGLNDNSQGVVIMFAPEGRIERVSYSQAPITSPNENAEFDGPVAENVYLLVGQRAKIPAPAIADDPTLDATKWGQATTDPQRQALRKPVNWLNDDSRWVVIGAQSGRVATIKNAFVELATITALGTPSELMRTHQIRKAREFTRDMIQDEGR
jgi:hypothetical protein